MSTTEIMPMASINETKQELHRNISRCCSARPRIRVNKFARPVNMRLILCFLITFFSVASHAASQPSPSNCQSDLKNLIVPDLKTAMNKQNLFAELAENDKGIYNIRLFVEADNPNRQVSVGWVVLDTNKRSAYDITRDEENPDKLNIDAEKYEDFSEKCLAPRTNTASQAIADTKLPFTFDRYYQCTTGTAKADECADRIHAYPFNMLEGALRHEIDPSMDTVLFLPSINDLRIVLAGRTETDVNIYALYTFRNNKLISKKTIGKMDGDIIQTFDISKDYLITTYERKVRIQSKISSVTHLKLEPDGQFITCTNARPTCK